MNTNSSFHRIARKIVPLTSQLSVVLGLFTMALMPIGANSSTDAPYIDPVAAVSIAAQPAVSSYAWIQALPARERFLAEKLTRLELLQGNANVREDSILSECSNPFDPQHIAVLAAQTGASRLAVFKAEQANCFPYTGH